MPKNTPVQTGTDEFFKNSLDFFFGAAESCLAPLSIEIIKHLPSRLRQYTSENGCPFYIEKAEEMNTTHPHGFNKHSSRLAVHAIAGISNLYIIKDALEGHICIEKEDLSYLSFLASSQILFAISSVENMAGVLKTEMQSLQKKGVKIYQGSIEGHDKRYAKGRELYAKAVSIAEEKWLNGCTMKHHKMRDWLLYEYLENETLIFTDPPINEKSLGKKLKEVLYKIGKEELIHGLSKKD